MKFYVVSSFQEGFLECTNYRSLNDVYRKKRGLNKICDKDFGVEWELYRVTKNKKNKQMEAWSTGVSQAS